jgi:hypothetical protein
MKYSKTNGITLMKVTHLCLVANKKLKLTKKSMTKLFEISYS